MLLTVANIPFDPAPLLLFPLKPPLISLLHLDFASQWLKRLPHPMLFQ